MNDPLYGNKIAFCVLSAILLIVGLPLLAANFFGGGGHHGGGHDDAHAEIFPQFPVEVQLASAEPSDEPVFDLGAMMAETEASKGERASLICKSCHTFNKGGAHLQGPNLWNVVGRSVASADGFNAYSGALKEYGGNWTYDRLNALIENSQAAVPGTAMVQRVRKDDRRAAILVYLSTLTDGEPMAFPAPLADEPAHEDDEHHETE